MSIKVVFSLAACGADGPLLRDPKCAQFLMKGDGDERTVGLSGGFPFLFAEREEDVYPELKEFISGYEITSRFQAGLALRKRGIYREGSAEITLTETFVDRQQAYSLTGRADKFADLDGLYRKIRAGQIGPEEDWDAAQGSPQLDDLRRQLAAECRRVVALMRELDQQDEQLHKSEARIAKLDDEKRLLETELRLLRENVAMVLSSIWNDTRSIPWWRFGRYVQKVVQNGIRGATMLQSLLPAKLQAEIEAVGHQWVR